MQIWGPICVLIDTDEFWRKVTVPDLEAVRMPLRQIMHHRDRPGVTALPPKIIDVTEDATSVEMVRRLTSLKTIHEGLSANCRGGAQEAFPYEPDPSEDPSW